MPRNFSELKSGGGGTIPMLSPHPDKWGGGRVPGKLSATVNKVGEFHFREVPRRSVATEPGEGSGRGGPPGAVNKKRLENRTLNGGFWVHFKLKIVDICYCLFAG